MKTPGGLRVAGVVPAAGASRRMGRPKGLLPLGEESFARRVVHALAAGGCAPTYVVVDADDDELAEELEDSGATILRNPDPGEGPITSLRLALAELSPQMDGIVYLPLDHALVEPRHVVELLEAAAASEASLALPIHRGKRGHPAYFGRSLFPELMDPELEGGARTVVHRHLGLACLLGTDDPAVITDIDTPEAYRDARELFASGAGGESTP
ncbi:MAG: nucleotidyltransferase family protein [Longimicrobiales bacterium]|nr:nucleotidyltransferase family protein [Longimicrobiales bacterium]